VGFLSPGILVLLGALLVLYGILVGGTWVRRVPGRMWDTVVPIIFIVISGLAVVNLVIVEVRQGDAFDKARDRLDCVSEQLAAVRVQATLPDCQIAWD
jgi:ATP/ADP translocase